MQGSVRPSGIGARMSRTTANVQKRKIEGRLAASRVDAPTPPAVMSAKVARIFRYCRRVLQADTGGGGVESDLPANKPGLFI
jgi:hypothetical protein